MRREPKMRPMDERPVDHLGISQSDGQTSERTVKAILCLPSTPWHFVEYGSTKYLFIKGATWGGDNNINRKTRTSYIYLKRYTREGKTPVWCKVRPESKHHIHSIANLTKSHDDVIKWKHLPCYWPFVPVTGEFPSQRPVTQSFDVFFDLQLNKRLN